MGDPEEYSAGNIALDNMSKIIDLKEKIKELEEKLESLDKDMNIVFEAINEFHRILYLNDSFQNGDEENGRAAESDKVQMRG